MGMGYYEQILMITSDYLGPAAGRFLERQLRTHFNKDPHELQRTDITSLAIRIRSGLMVLTQDELVVNEAYRRLIAVADMQLNGEQAMPMEA